jgi:hypothetical protein
VVEIPDLSAMQVEFPVHEVDRHRVATGMAVRVRLEAYPEAGFGGTIAEIARLATEIEDDSSVRAFTARAPLEGADPRLRPGMTAVVEIACGTVTDVVLAPRAALFSQAETPVVFPRTTWPEPQPVRLGALTPLVAEIREGLEAGAELVTEPPGVLTEDQPQGSAPPVRGGTP